MYFIRPCIQCLLLLMMIMMCVIRDAYFPKLQQIQPNFMALPNTEKLSLILGGNSQMITIAASCVSACPRLRLSVSAPSLMFFFYNFFYNVLNICLVCEKPFLP